MCNTNNAPQFKAASIVTKKEHLDRESTYHVDGKSFIVTPVFLQQEGKETLGSVLLKLIQTDATE